mmetsp:Transcript_7328/g.6485  ORF Transcript_7328/g.6485 Transcript_7328/m.6485 type:complete len:95 (+) Transcript_7328:2-286(+)
MDPNMYAALTGASQAPIEGAEGSLNNLSEYIRSGMQDVVSQLVQPRDVQSNILEVLDMIPEENQSEFLGKFKEIADKLEKDEDTVKGPLEIPIP